MNKSIKIVGLVVVGLTASAMCAVPYYSSKALNDKLSAMAARGHPQDGYLIRNLQHQAGFFSSRGTAEVVLTDRCNAGGDAAATSWRVEYDATHIPTPGSANRFHWKLSPMGENAKIFKKIFGSEAPLQGNGQITWSGLVKSDMQLPAMSYASGKETLEAAPSQGSLAFNDKAFQFDWKLERILIRGQEEAVELRQIGVNMDLSNRRRGIGEMALTLGEFSSREASGKGLLLQSITKEANDRIDSTLTESLQQVQWAKQELKDLALEASVQGLHAPSVEALTDMISSSCGVQALTRDETLKVRQAVQTLLATGFSAGITKLAGQGKQGAIDGKVAINLASAGAGHALSFAKLLSSEGRLLIKGDLIQAEQKQMLIATGMIKETPEGLLATFRFDKGDLTVNGQPMNSRPIVAMLTMMDTAVLAFLEDEKPFAHVAAQEAVESSPEEPASEDMAAAPADAPAEPPTTAAAATALNTDSPQRP